MSTINIIRKFEHQLTLAAAYDMAFEQLFGVIGQTSAAVAAQTNPKPTILLHLWSLSDAEMESMESGEAVPVFGTQNRVSMCGLVWDETPGADGDATIKCPACVEASR